MKKNLLLIGITLILSCNQKPQVMRCNEFINESFKGKATIFFHKPISGSTYQIFLFPLCKDGFDSKIQDFSCWKNLGNGISFNLTSDDPQFKILNKNAKMVNLKDRDQVAENFRSIYYCFGEVEVLFGEDSAKNAEETKKLTVESGSVVLKYHFLSFVSFKIPASLTTCR